MSTRVRTALVSLAIVAAGAVAGACSSVPDNSRIGVLTPDITQFGTTPAGHGPADVLAHRCGSLDCHGNAQRNWVVWSCEGLRLDPNDLPGCRNSVVPGGKNTTADEYNATFRSLVGLEPVVMSAVIQDKGQHPELLTFVRKARGDESHKGGALIVPGDEQDQCIASWLAGATKTDQCDLAITKNP